MVHTRPGDDGPAAPPAMLAVEPENEPEKKQDPESSSTVSSVVEGVVDSIDVVGSILSIFE